MTETPEGSPAGDPQDVLTALRERIASDSGNERREALQSFAKAFLRRLSDEDLLAAGPDTLFGMVSSAFGFADSKGTNASAVRVFNPTIERDGYETVGSVIETSTDDSPFLVDSVNEELLARNLVVSRLLHPVVGTIRDAEGRIERVLSGRDASHRESVMHFEVDRPLTDDEREKLAARVKQILHDVRLVVRDFEPMQERVKHMIELARGGAVRYSPQEVGETVDFLDWLLQYNFVLLGYREYELLELEPEQRAIRAVPGSGLGILSDVQRSAFADPTRLSALDPVIRRRIEDGDLLVFSKTNAYSSVHRRARMDYIGVRIVNPQGEILGRGAPDRAVHVEGVHGAGHQDTVAPPQAGTDPRGRGPDPGFARLQGGRRTLRVLPEGRALPGLHPGTAPAGGGTAAAGEARRDPGAGSQGPVRAQRVGGGGASTRSVQRRAAQAPAAVLPGAVPGGDGRLPPLARGNGVGAHLLHRAPGAGLTDPGSALRSAGDRGREAGPQLGRRPQGRVDGPDRSRAGHDARREVLAPVPQLLQGLGRVGAHRRRRAGARSARVQPRGLPRGDRQREQGRTPHAREAVQDRRQGGSVGVHPDPGSAGPAGRGGDPHRGPGRGQGVHPRFRRAGRTRRGARPGRRGRHGRRNDRRGLARRM